MTRFDDEKTRSWEVEVNGYTLKKCKERLNINLMDIDEELSLFQQLATDVALMGDVLWVCCEDQASEQGVSEKAFFEGLLGDSVVSAQKALFEALVNFIPNPHKRKAVGDAWEKVMALSNKSVEMASITMVEALKKLDVDSEAQKLIDTFSNLQQSSG